MQDTQTWDSSPWSSYEATTDLAFRFMTYILLEGVLLVQTPNWFCSIRPSATPATSLNYRLKIKWLNNILLVLLHLNSLSIQIVQHFALRPLPHCSLKSLLLKAMSFLVCHNLLKKEPLQNTSDTTKIIFNVNLDCFFLSDRRNRQPTCCKVHQS